MPYPWPADSIRAPIALRKAVSVVCLLISASVTANTPSSVPDINTSVLAHWPFDETTSLTTMMDAAHDGRYVAIADREIPRVRGVHGHALDLRGSHAIRVDNFGVPELDAITLAAWCRPVDLSGYREIFRQESKHRLLFSFQEHGAILSLGLYIDGYVECDAPIAPARLLEGNWHHCAATFDGHFMRVFLNGEEVGSRERPGRLLLDPTAPAFIASSSGTSEHFQGRLDDLRIYTEALTSEQIAAMYENGREILAVRMQEITERAAQFYHPLPTFAETLAAAREKAQRARENFDVEYAEALSLRMKADFAEKMENFTAWTGRSVGEYITTAGNGFHYDSIGRLMNLMLEYKPLTDAQWAKQSREERRQWKEAEGLYQRYEQLRQAGLSARYSPEWIELALAAGARIDFRPTAQEAVAPYRPPTTPATRTRTPEEARRILERDWLHQVNANPDCAAIRNEIRWTRALAQRIMAAHEESDFSEALTQLDELAQQAMMVVDQDARLYFQVREIKRGIMFANPVLYFERLLLVDRPYPQGSEWQHETRHRLGYMSTPGGKLVVLEGLHPGGKVQQLMPQEPLHGTFWRPDVSFDGQRVLFCFQPHNEKSFHLYEINADGTGLIQLTDSPYDDLDPIYLPDENHILFTTTRGHTYVRCMPPTNAFVLARANRDGSDIYLVSANNEPDYLPSVMHDGRVIYTRWEYTDKPLWRAQSLWTVNPDGAQPNTLWGNQSVWPDLLKDARAIPGSRRVMFTGSAHHHWFRGSVGIIDPELGFNFPDGLAKVTADMEWPESGNGPVDPIESFDYHSAGKYSGYYSPYPLGEQDFMVSADRDGKFVLYLMDVDGNRELIYEGENHVFYAIPLAPRPRPPVIPDRAQFPTRAERDNPAPGVIYSADVYQGAPEILRGKARYLRILNIDHKTYTYWHKRPYLSSGPVVSAVQSEGVKRIIGTVPIEDDGSVSFQAPAGIPLHFQLLDEEQRALQTMRSFVNVMPGESRGCLGCHELHSRAPESDLRAAALRRPPSAITPPPWDDDTVSYARYVRPVLEKYCVRCHEGDGEGRKTFDMTERPASPIFTEPYMTMIGRPSWGAPYNPPADPPPGFGIAGQLMVEGYDQRDPEGYVTPEPMTALSYRSRLVEIASSGEHHDVQIDEISRLRLITWVDAMTPYQGLDEIRAMPDPDFQGINWLAVRPRIQTAPVIIRPGPVE